MASIFDMMLNHETGEIDEIVLADAAEVRARHEERSQQVSPKALREATAWCRERAETMRRVWRQHKGLPPDEPMTMMNVPDWGSSGDSFGRSR
jgi:hypothetical protein